MLYLGNLLIYLFISYLGICFLILIYLIIINYNPICKGFKDLILNKYWKINIMIVNK